MVLEGLTIGGESRRDRLEALDHAEAFDYMYDLAGRDTPFAKTDLGSLHQRVLQRSEPHDAGGCRDIPVWLSGRLHVPPPPIAVPSLVEDLCAELAAAGSHHPVRTAAWLHARLVAIPPFAGGSGRHRAPGVESSGARRGCPPAIIQPTPEARALYFQALQDFHEGRREPIVTTFAQACAHTADFILRRLAQAGIRASRRPVPGGHPLRGCRPPDGLHPVQWLPPYGLGVRGRRYTPNRAAWTARP